jgi:hypothetical protein
VPLAADERFTGFALRLQRIEFLIEPLLGGFAGVDRTANPSLRRVPLPADLIIDRSSKHSPA